MAETNSLLNCRRSNPTTSSNLVPSANLRLTRQSTEKSTPNFTPGKGLKLGVFDYNHNHLFYIKISMPNLFKLSKAINAILYSLQQLGGKTDMHKLCKILYFADQTHLSTYGRSITGDRYIAMQYGPVPSAVDDIFKALRGDSFFSSSKEIEPFREIIQFENRFILRGKKKPDLDELSVSDIKCLNDAIEICRNKSFKELTTLSHGLAWTNTQKDRTISVKDILREAGDEEAYVEYIADNLKTQSAFL